MLSPRHLVLCGAVPLVALLATAAAALPGVQGRPAAISAPAAGDRLLAEAITAFRKGDYAVARAQLRLLAHRENPTAETLLGTMSANGQGGPRDPAVAAAWFLRAARRGYAPAQLALADAFARGSGVAADPVQARALALAAAQQGQPGASQLAARLGPERYAQLAGGRP